jgi:cytochrome bd-type quinol oxidase subunit 2
MSKFAKIALVAGSLGAALMPMVAHGQATTFSIESVDVGLGTADLKETVLNILQLVLGLLALIAVVMIIWGGFTWLTAGGNEEKVEQAKRIITAAIIGLIVILLAWAIVIFVARTTANVTN